MADVPEHSSDTPPEKSEANHVQITATQKKKRKKRKCYVSFSSESWSTDTHSEPDNKRSQQNLIFTSFRNLQLAISHAIENRKASMDCLEGQSKVAENFKS